MTAPAPHADTDRVDPSTATTPTVPAPPDRRRRARRAGLAALAVAAVSVGGLLTVAQTGAQAAGSPQVRQAAASPAVAGRNGWQGKFTYALPAGSGGVFFHYGCGVGFVPRAGGWSVNGVGQAGVKIVGEGPRWDTNYGEYFWTLLWPGGAPSGVTIDFDVFCTKAPI
ncbi:hypothetical protein [Lapillicoccus jejuensis]|uniref:Uncharacterized protein n=1 Tax=Lapillicoccus jejuensis TaxID=402171 RepID=A0A542E5Z3_9MICO|nr:hypothetical protein [Lapillicoccus jejuensis]TQJ10689.1 hypothetical protein FB458_3818 [Lapillicoccus jejuensis]